MKTFRQISLYVGEFEYLNRQREEAASRLQTSRTRESELQRQVGKRPDERPKSRGFECAVGRGTGRDDAFSGEGERPRTLVQRQEESDQRAHASVQPSERMRIRSCDDVTALRRLLTWLDPASARPIRYKLGKVAPALLEGIELWARLLEIELPAGRDTVIEGQPVEGDVFIPGDV